MNHTLLTTVVASLPGCLLVMGAVVWFSRAKTVAALLQLLGAGFFFVVIVVHAFEALHLFDWMGWGLEHSPGHYLDLLSASLGLSLFPLGYLLQALKTQRR